MDSICRWQTTLIIKNHVEQLLLEFLGEYLNRSAQQSVYSVQESEV